MSNINSEYDGLAIPTYITYSIHNCDVQNLISLFSDKPEFAYILVELQEHKNYSIAKWASIVKAVTIAVENDDDVIILCEEGHEFTNSYNSQLLFNHIVQGAEQGTLILFGGVHEFGQSVPVAANRFWLNSYTSSKFMILYRGIFSKILDYRFRAKDKVDEVLSNMTSHKMLLYPFISVDSTNDSVRKYQNTVSRLDKLRNAYHQHVKIV